MLIKYFFILFFCFITQLAFSQDIETEWSKCIGGNNSDFGGRLLKFDDNEYYVLAYSSSTDLDVEGNHGGFSDTWITKIDSSGNILFSRCYGGSGQDELVSIIKTPSNELILAGYSTTDNDGDINNNRGIYDLWTLKLGANGDTIWSKCYGGSDSDMGACIINGFEGIYVVGTSFSTDGNLNKNYGDSDIWLIKTDSLGELIYSKNFGGSEEDAATSIIQSYDSSLYILGTTFSTDGDITSNNGGRDLVLMKLNPDGELLWSKTYGGSYDEYSTQLIETFDSTLVILASTYSNDGDISGNNGGQDVWLLNLDPTGEIISSACYGGSLHDNCKTIIQASDGSFIIGGQSFSSDGNLINSEGETDFWISKINNNIQWSMTFGGTGFESISGIQEISDNDFIVSGQTSSPKLYNCERRGSTLYEDLYLSRIRLFQNFNSSIGLCNGDSIFLNGEYQKESGIVQNPIVPENGYSGKTYIDLKFGTCGLLSLPNKNIKVSVYPNPCSNLLKIDLLTFKSVEIYNNLGILELTSNESTIDLSDLYTGYYYLRIHDYYGNIFSESIFKY